MDESNEQHEWPGRPVSPPLELFPKLTPGEYYAALPQSLWDLPEQLKFPSPLPSWYMPLPSPSFAEPKTNMTSTSSAQPWYKTLPKETLEPPEPLLSTSPLTQHYASQNVWKPTTKPLPKPSQTKEPSEKEVNVVEQIRSEVHPEYRYLFDDYLTVDKK